MHKIEDHLFENEEVLAKASPGEAYLNEKPLGFRPCRIVFYLVCVQFLCLVGDIYLQVTLGPRDTSMEIPIFAIINYFVFFMFFIMGGVSVVKNASSGFTYEELTKTYNKSKESEYLSNINFSGVSHSTYYYYWIVSGVSLSVLNFCYFILRDPHQELSLDIFTQFGNDYRFISLMLFIFVISVFPFLICLVNLLFGPSMRRKKKTTYYVTNRRIIEFERGTGKIKFLDLSFAIDLCVQDDNGCASLKYTGEVNKQDLAIYEVSEIRLSGVNVPGKFLQAAANVNYKALHSET